MKHVVISILNFNGQKNTDECLDSLETLKLPDIKLSVVVIDNASSKKYENNKMYKNFDLHLIQNDQNIGFGRGHNMGMSYATSQKANYIIILNNDTTVDSHLVEHLVNSFENNMNIGIAGPKIYFSKGNEFHKDRYKKEDLGKVIWYAGGIMDWENVIGKHRGVDEVDSGEYDQIEQTDFVSGCCMIISLDVFKKVGGFDDKYFLYYEDSDLNQKIKKAGYETLYNPHAVVWHKNAGSTGSGSELQDYYISRNRLLFGLRYAPLHSKAALIKESMEIYRKGRKWQKIGVRDFYFFKFGKGSFPV